MSYGLRKTKNHWAVPPVRLGALAPSSDPVAVFLNGVLSSPWLYVGGGLLLFFLVKRMVGGSVAPKRRRKSSSLSPFTVAVYAAGAGAGGYLLGRYTTI